MKKRFLHTTIAMAVLMLAFSSLELQSEADSTSAGKEFVLCFPYNEVTPELKLLEYHLQVFITSFNGEPCNVNISYNLDGELIEIEETVSGENMLKVEFPGEMEIVGHLENENKGIFITSDQDINVYGFSMCGATTDAFLCYPTTALDTSYIVTSYKNLIHSYNKYSNLHIVATEDDTEVAIYPTAPLESWGDNKPDKVTIMMNKGDARQIIARVTNEYDLTGSIVKSNKKIVVYSTHQNQFVNPTIGGNSDVLIEQNLPISRLGTNTIFSPTHPANKLANTVARIVSPFDDNHIKFSDATIILNKQEFYEFVYDSCLYVETSKPALFAMYCSSTSAGKDDVGPNMILLPPVEYYLNRYISVAPKYEYKFSHILNLIISEVGLETLTINGEPVTNQNYSPIYGTEYVFLWDWVEAGVHVIESDSEFGIIAHGFASADGYGYIPGMKTERETDIVYDKSPPMAYFDNGCIGTLLLADEGADKTGIAGMKPLEIDNLIYYEDVGYVDEYSMRYFCELIDPLRDGFMKYEVTDVAGNTRIDSLLLKGFTMTGVPPLRDTIYYNTVVCGEIDLENIGSFEQEFESYFAKNIVFSVTQSDSLMKVASGSRATLIYCMSSLQLGTMRDTLMLVDSCGRVVRIPFEVEVVSDKSPPVSYFDNGCIGTLLIADEGEYKRGIAEMEPLEIDNLIYYEDVGYVDEYSMRYFCELIDPLRDGFMKYEVTDVAGNTRIDSLLLKGFTMVGTPPERDTIYFNALVCGEIDLENIGSFEQEFDSYFAENVVFSVPQSVSQMKVTNGSRATQIYCMSSLQLGTVRDTLMLVDSCGRVVRLPLEVEVLPNAYAATSRCDVPLRAVTSEQHRISYEDGTLSLANFEGEISIYNLLGEQLFRRHYSNATHTEQLDFSAGVYFLVAIDADGKHEFMKVMGE